MNSRHPYLLRAMYEWIVDNDCTPYIVVETESLSLPPGVVDSQDKTAVLDVSQVAVRHLIIGNEWIEFDVRLEGRIRHLQIPIGAVAAIYAAENNEGFIFDRETLAVAEAEDEAVQGTPQSTSKTMGTRAKKMRKPSHLKVVK